MTATPIAIYQANWWDKRQPRMKRTLPTIAFTATVFDRIMSGEMFRGATQVVKPQPTAQLAKLTAAAPAREILKAIKAGQRLCQAEDGHWFLQRIGEKARVIRKKVKAKYVLALEAAKALVRRAMEMVLPEPSQALRKANILRDLAIKAQAKGKAAIHG